MKIKIGDTIYAILFGGKAVTGKIKSIQICKEGEKQGREVKSCDIRKHNNGVVDLDCGNWCYFYQIKEVRSK